MGRSSERPFGCSRSQHKTIQDKVLGAAIRLQPRGCLVLTPGSNGCVTVCEGIFIYKYVKGSGRTHVKMAIFTISRDDWGSVGVHELDLLDLVCVPRI